MPFSFKTATQTRTRTNLVVLTVVVLAAGFLIGSHYLAAVAETKKLLSDEQLSAVAVRGGARAGKNVEVLDLEKAKEEYLGFIVELKQPPLVEKTVSGDGGEVIQREKAGKNLDTHRASIQKERAAFKTKLEKIIPSKAANMQEYDVAFNGVFVQMNKEQAEQVKKISEVKRVVPNYRVYVTLRDSVPMIGADKVWEMATTGKSCITPTSTECLTGKGVTIGIIDTGVDYTHPDLAANYIGGWDFVNWDSDPMDDHGHGTHVAGIAAGNGVVKGVAPEASVVAYKVLDQNGSGWMSTIIMALERAIDPNQDGDFSDRLDVVNLSLGGWGDPDDPTSLAADTAMKAGVTVVVAAGNSGSWENTINSPGTSRFSLTVGAVDKSNYIAWFSSRGPALWKDTNGLTLTLVKPDVVAPGVSICSAQWQNAWSGSECIDGDHVSLSGTSMATPHVAGLAALLRQKNPSWTSHQIKMAIMTKAEGSREVVTSTVTTRGYGIVNALETMLFKGIPSYARLGTNITFTGSSLYIKGQATGRMFMDYVLFYATKAKPDTWIELVRSNKPISGIFIKGVSASLFDEGENYLRLLVRNKMREISEDRSIIFINNIAINEPKNNDVFRAGSPIKISGQLRGSFSGFGVEYWDGSGWSSSGITLTNSGAGGKEVKGQIALWKTDPATNKGFYKLRVLVYRDGSEPSIETVENIYIDNFLHAGWPQKISYDKEVVTGSLYSPETLYVQVMPSQVTSDSQEKQKAVVMQKNDYLKQISLASSETYYYHPGMLLPVVADIDKNGAKEVIVYKGGIVPQLIVYRQNGTLWWKQNVGAGRSNAMVPLATDLNNDGYLEVVAYNMQYDTADNSKLVAFRHNKTVLWTTTLPREYGISLVAADIDNNGSKEIIAKGSYNWYIIDGKTGSIVRQHPYDYYESMGSDMMPHPAIGNFDNDEDYEIVISRVGPDFGYDYNSGVWTNDAMLTVYNADGTTVAGWPARIREGDLSSSPVVADIDKNGQDDIVIGYTYATNSFPDMKMGGLYAFGRDGRVLPGWPQRKGYNFRSTPSLGDLDQDGIPEIVASELGFRTNVFNSQGNLMPGWPQYTSWNDYFGSIIADINGDYQPDVLTTAGNGFYPALGNGGVYAWTKNGVLHNGFPKVTEMDAQAPAVIDDIDKDGLPELIASSNWDYDFINGTYKMRGSLYVWDIEGTKQDMSRPERNFPWPRFMHDNDHSGLFTPFCVHNGKTYVREGNDQEIYLLERCVKRLFPSVCTFTEMGYKTEDIIVLSETEHASYPTGITLPLLCEGPIDDFFGDPEGPNFIEDSEGPVEEESNS